MSGNSSVADLIKSAGRAEDTFTALWDIAGSTEKDVRLAASCGSPWMMFPKQSIQSIEIIDVEWCLSETFHKVRVTLKGDQQHVAVAIRAGQAGGCGSSPRPSAQRAPGNLRSLQLAKGLLMFAVDSLGDAISLTYIPD
jgi:hypothetical protein